MIVMNLALDNLFGFRDFHINFSYPKKIVNSTIESECLESKPNFRYKKLAILMGSNASGKTSIGKALMMIFNFIDKSNVYYVLDNIRNHKKTASFSIDFLCDEDVLYRVRFKVDPVSQKNVYEKQFLLGILSSKIRAKDSYESCVENLKEVTSGDSFSDLQLFLADLQHLPKLSRFFTFSEKDTTRLFEMKKDFELNILDSVLKTLDSSITCVEKSKEVENSYIIRSKNGDVIIQNNEVVNKNILSSGTKMGIDIAKLISSMTYGKCGFYFCDEKFSFIQSDIEIAILSLMISLLKPCSQLFFTSHNLDLLEMSLPIHSFVFLRNRDKIEVVYPEKIIKKNDVSIRNAVKNDVFKINPDIDKMIDLDALLKAEVNHETK